MNGPGELTDRIRVGCLAALAELESGDPAASTLAALVDRLTDPALRLAVAGPLDLEVSALAGALHTEQPTGAGAIRVLAGHGDQDGPSPAECDALVLLLPWPTDGADPHPVGTARDLVAALGLSAANAVGVLLQPVPSVATPVEQDSAPASSAARQVAARYARDLRASVVDVVTVTGLTTGEASGVDALRGIIARRFVPAVDALRAASALRTVAALAWAPGTTTQQRATVRLRELGCALRGRPALRILALGAALARLDPGELVLSDATRDDLANLMHGGTAAEQVGLPPYAPAREVAAAADERIRRWRAWDALHAPAAQRCVRLAREAFEAIYYATGPTLDHPTDRR